MPRYHHIYLCNLILIILLSCVLYSQYYGEGAAWYDNNFKKPATLYSTMVQTKVPLIGRNETTKLQQDGGIEARQEKIKNSIKDAQSSLLNLYDLIRIVGIF